MDNTSNRFTPVSKLNVTPAQRYPSSSKLTVTSKSSDKINKTLLTPCRRVGLKRKSITHTPRLLLKDSTLEQNICIDSSNDLIRVSKSPDSKHVECITEQTVIADVSKLQNCHNIEILDKGDENMCNPQSSLSTNKCIWVGDKRRKVSKSKLHASNEVPVKPGTINLELLESLASNIKEKKNRYKHIELSKLYEKKHDLQTLKDLTIRWKQGCQKALLELHHLIQQNGHTLSMVQLLAHFQIPHDFIGYNEECDDFE